MEYCRQASIAVEHARADSSELYYGYGKSRLKGLGLEYIDFREYEPGDDFRRIDWRLTARSPGVEGFRLFVKEYEEEHMHDVSLAVSLSPSIFYKDKPYTMTYTASLVTLLAQRLGDRLTLHLLGGGIERIDVSLPTAPYRVKKAVCSGPRKVLGRELLTLAKTISRGTLVLVLDYDLDPGILAQTLRAARSRGIGVLTILVYSLREVKPPGPGEVLVTSPSGSVYGDLNEIYDSIIRHVNRVDSTASAYSRTIKVESSSVRRLRRRIVDEYLRARSRRA
ncbi:MAG: DUF58 domain-containing protein [Desulfurococcales archaeon]|nr:DUF58 domain-containing protein [Desulfurococcales archaeon]